MPTIREPATITNTEFGRDRDHDTYIARVYCHGEGWCQALEMCLPSLVLVEHAKRSICLTATAFDPEDLKGKRVHVLRCFERNNEPIEGFEMDDGKRFTKTSWCRAAGVPTKSPFAYECERLESELARCEHRLVELQEERATLRSRYRNWEL